MERLANPLISFSALFFTEWGLSSCRHHEPMLDSNERQRWEKRREGRCREMSWKRRESRMKFDVILYEGKEWEDEKDQNGNEVKKHLEKYSREETGGCGVTSCADIQLPWRWYSMWVVCKHNNQLSVWLSPTEWGVLTVRPSVCVRVCVQWSVFPCLWQWGFCWLQHDRERERERTKADVVFFCLAREPWHSICLYPSCWQQQPPAPCVTTTSACSLFLFLFWFSFSAPDQYSEFISHEKNKSSCMCTHVSEVCLGSCDGANNATGEEMFLCDQMLHTVSAVWLCQHQPIKKQLWHAQGSTSIVISLPFLTLTHTHH